MWQEFPLACNNYEGTPHYLKILEQESRSIIKRLKKHPSLAMWSGGNELFNNWSGMTDQSAAIRLLNSQCFLLDPGTPFIPTSPVMGVGHGHYVFRDWQSGEEVFQEMTRSRFTAYTEFGMPAPASVEILKTIIPVNELWPPKPGTSWESHHAYKAWVGNTWLCQDIIEDYFGPVGFTGRTYCQWTTYAGRRLQMHIRGGKAPETILFDGCKLVFQRTVAHCCK